MIIIWKNNTINKYKRDRLFYAYYVLGRRETMTCLEGEQVTIGYGDNVIVDQLDVHIPTGKITSIIGPNGCGKSTLLKALSRLLPIKGRSEERRVGRERRSWWTWAVSEEK